MAPIIVIDNFDSFTYNLVQYLGELGAVIRVFRNDAISLDALAGLQPAGVVISPGPGRPETAGISVELVRAQTDRFPVLGVCLGHQAIGQAFGARIVPAPELMHGKTSAIHHDQTGVFANLPNPFTATRYHSLMVAPDSLPDCLQVTARTQDGIIMGLAHTELPVYGVQFHPESFLTEAGRPLLQNFLDCCGAGQAG